MDHGESSYRRFLEGDKNAFDHVFALYYDSLTFFANRYVENIHDAEDIAINTLLELLLHPKRYNFRTPLKAYLFAIARNKSLNFLRDHRKDTVLPEDAEGELADNRSLAEELIKKEEHRALNQALDTLPADLRAAVHLVYFEELSYEQAARVMGKSKKQIDNLLYRAKAILRDTLGKEMNL